MAEPQDSCINWNKYGSAGEIGASEIGVNGTAFNFSATPVKFGNGSYSNGATIYNSFPLSTGGTNIDQDDFMYEAWFKTDWNCTNGIAPGSPDYTWFSVTSPPFFNGFYIRATVSGIHFENWVNTAVTDYTITTNWTWSAGDIMHILLAHKRAGIDGGADKVRAFLHDVNGNEIATYISTTASAASTVSTWTEESHRVFGGKSFNGAIDNRKFYMNTSGSLITAVNNNMLNEGFPAAATGKLLDYGNPLLDGVML